MWVSYAPYVFRMQSVSSGLQSSSVLPYYCTFFILKILHEGHTLAAEAASTEGQQQDTAIAL